MVRPAEPGFKPAVPARPQLATQDGPPDTGDILVSMILAHRRRDHREVKRHRQSLRLAHRLDVTLGRVPDHENPGQLGFELDRLVDAMAAGNYKLAASYHKGLLDNGVAVVPLDKRGDGS